MADSKIFKIGTVVSNTKPSVSSSSKVSNISDGMLQSINELAKKEWAVPYTYMVYIDRFKGSAFPKGIVPAFSLSEYMTLAITEKISIGKFGSLEIPKGRQLPTLNISFYEDDNCSCEKLFRDWVHDIMTGYLEDYVSKITIFKLNKQRQIVFSQDYYAYPTGDSAIQLGNSTDVRNFNVNFNVVLDSLLING